MERIGTKLKQKFKLPDSSSVKLSKKKNELTNSNNNSNSDSPSSGTVVAQLKPIANSSASQSQYTPPVEVCGSQNGRPGKVVNSQRVTSITSTPSSSVSEESRPSVEDQPSPLAPLRRRTPQQRASCYLPEGVESRGACDQVRRGEMPQGEQGDLQGGAYSPSSRAALNQRRYSLELQQLVRRQQLLSQPPLSSMPPLYPSHSPVARSGATEPGFLPELERHKRLSLQEALFYKRWSSGGEPWDSGRPASLSHPPQRSHDGAGVAYLFPSGPALSPCSSFSLQESVLASPRSSFASSTASGGGGAGGSPVGSPCSSNRTSGISLGYDTRHMPGPAQQLQFSSTQLGGASSGQVYVATAPGKAGTPPMEVWRDYLERSSGMGGGFQESRHSYPPALSTPTATGQKAEPEWWGGSGQRAAPRVEGLGERVRHSDLPGTHYQQELTRLLLRDLALEGEVQLGGLTLKEQPLSTCVPAPVPATAAAKSQEEQRAARDPPSALDRQEFFGTCVKCSKGVYGVENACQALDSLYHTRCFTCVSCGRTLRNKDFYNVSGSVYCKEDYMFSGFQAAAEKCSVCGHLILEQILQALGNSYHPGCFRCTVCSKTLDGVPFTVDYLNNVYCVSDYNRTFAPKCAACLQPILPAEGSEEILRVVSMNKDYHFECYHCEECGKQLSDKPGSQCFPLDSHLLCHSCHMTRACATQSLPPHNTH
ncbi:LIM domain-containing protein ajuba-like [Brachyhypopomus gauderio]|uniref:LIM domain-containing protein ajuba-like n=1 Tax=Brachyhypopomus gauderio TaxID=698409 RepID=UPI00404276EB